MSSSQSSPHKDNCLATSLRSRPTNYLKNRYAADDFLNECPIDLNPKNRLLFVDDTGTGIVFACEVPDVRVLLTEYVLCIFEFFINLLLNQTITITNHKKYI
ncbi:unnamed protein product [Pneumocystis jirovecii]|uniref:Uncharacterized protein n=1 Tax=Pneumocystis jirovecii TaxID=42068 RepID=L0PIE3_PNEJI|nr:unnamed protein product [Pneumocystis jirovecii]